MTTFRASFPAVSAVGLLVVSGCIAAPPQVIQVSPPTVAAAAPPATGGAVVAVEIPPAYYPPPGACRIWVPGVAPERQAAPGDCAALQSRVPAGALLVHGR